MTINTANHALEPTALSSRMAPARRLSAKRQPEGTRQSRHDESLMVESGDPEVDAIKTVVAV